MDREVRVYIATIVIAFIVCGIVLLIRHLRGNGSKEYTARSIKITAIISVVLLIALSAVDIIDHSYASRSSEVILALALFAWVAWSLWTQHELDEIKKFKDDHYIFYFSKDYHSFHVSIGSDISHFLNNNEMDISSFEEDIVIPGIRIKMEEYQDSHPRQHTELK